MKKKVMIQMKNQVRVKIIGGGLAGAEAAYQLAKRHIYVDLYEMRPQVKTDVHETENLAELVCSNSFRSNSLTNAVGVLKEEMRILDSLIMKMADKHQIPAGSALAVDRVGFSNAITEYIENNEYINFIREEVTEIPDSYAIIASGPLTSSKFSEAFMETFSNDYFHFFDAVAPIVSFDSIDLDKAYFKSRYDKGGDDYLNCPMNREQFFEFYNELINAKVVASEDYEDETFFNACQPIEEIAKSGMKSLLFGPMKPVGLRTPDGQEPFAVVQLRQDNSAKSLYNLVGFQTRLTWGEQKRIIQLIPGLENAEIVRYGVMHKNSYINSPVLLNRNLQIKVQPHLFVAGQFSGVEGYIESSAMGMLAGINMAKLINEEALLNLENDTMIGALANYIVTANPQNFQPMNINFSLVRANEDYLKKERREKLSEQALSIITSLKDHV